MTIIQTYLSSSENIKKECDIEQCGMGTIIWVPIHQYTSDRSLASLFQRFVLLQKIRSPEAKSSLAASLVGVMQQLRYRTMLFSDGITDIVRSAPVDLMLFHRLTYDVPQIVASAQSKNIPFGVVNHFRNGQLAHALPLIRKAAAVAGVSSTEVPAELQGKFLLLSDAVDMDFFNPELARPVVHPKQSMQKSMLALLAGRITCGKGHMDMISIIKQAEARGVRISLAFAGVTEVGALIDELQQTIAQLQLQDRVFFLGELPREQLRNWYAAADVVVLPSLSEGLPRTILEAQAMEKPVVAYNAGGTSDAISVGTTGFLVETGDQAAFVTKLISLHDDAERRREMGRRGRQFIMKNFSIESLVERHENLCLTVLNRAQNKCVNYNGRD